MMLSKLLPFLPTIYLLISKTPLFEYIGTETIKDNELKHRQSLYEKEIFNFREKTTTLYKFKVLER